MKFNGLVAFISLSIMSSSPALADWKYTQWGESLSSILAKQEQKIEPTTDKEEHSEGKIFGLAKAKTTYKASNTTFNVLFLFTNDKLSRVSLMIDNTKTAARLLSDLGDQYGAPEQMETRSDTCLSKSKIWRDVPNGNIVEFSGFDCGPGAASDYRIIYRPILIPENTGL